MGLVSLRWAPAALVITGGAAFAAGGHLRSDARVHAMLCVGLRRGGEPLVAPPGSVRWVNEATARRLAWRYGRSDPIAPVAAVIGGRKWAFRVDGKKREATLTLKDDVRHAWERHGTRPPSEPKA